MTHICVVKLPIIGSDNGLSPGRRQAIILTNAGILLIGTLGTNFIEILIGIQTFSFKKMHLNMSSAKWRPFCLGLNVLNPICMTTTSPTHSCECGAPIECDFHYFMECHRYIIQRDKLQRKILNPSSFTMKTTLYGDDGASLDTNKNIFTAVCEYIQTSKRFEPANQ